MKLLSTNNKTFIPETQSIVNCYIYLDPPFSNDWELKLIIQKINNKVRKTIYSIKGFFKNPHIPIPYKRILFSAIVIGQVLYYAPSLRSNKKKRELVTSLYCISKELTYLQRYQAVDVMYGILKKIFKAFLNSKSNASSLDDSNQEASYSECVKNLFCLFNKIWNYDFPDEWNSVSFVFISKKRDLSDCNN